MMIVLLLLGAFVCMGRSDEIQLTKVYGSSHQFKVPRRTHSIEFSPEYMSDGRILWMQGKPILDGRHTRTKHFFTVSNFTHMDSGRYIMRDKHQEVLSTYTLDITAISRTYDRLPGGHMNFTLDLEPQSCNIYFSSYSNHADIEVVKQGKLQEDLDRFGCKGFELLKPCGISNDALQMSCEGNFYIRDQNYNTALEVSLVMKSPPASYISNGVGFSLAILFGGVLLRSLCGGTASKKKRAATSAAKRDVQYQEYDREPSRPRPEQLSRPSRTHTPTVLLIHSPPDMNGPLASSEVSAAAELADPPTDPEPRFELKGMTCFTSDSNHCEVYTSDKLNFL